MSTKICASKTFPLVVISVWSPTAAVVVFVIVVPAVPEFTVACITKDATAPLLRFPKFHSPDPLLYAPDELSLK